MKDRVHFFVHSNHSIGGVTTWAFQAAKFVSAHFDSQILSMRNGNSDIPNRHLFPGSTVSISNDGQHHNFAQKRSPQSDVIPKPRTLFAGKEDESPDTRKDVNSRWQVNAEKSKEYVEVFIPNYIDHGYQLAAISRVENTPSRCIGICHADQEIYYELLVRYAPIIQTFITVSSMCTNKLVGLLPHRRRDIKMLPYGVDIPSYSKSSWSTGPIKLLYTGRLVKKQKRILDFVDLFVLLEEMKIEYHFDFWGVGPDELELKSAISKFSRVRICSGVPHAQMSNIYQNYDVILLASDFEGTSISMLEGMAHGLVPIVTNVSGAEDVIRNGINGFLFEVGDINALAEKIVLLSEDNETKARMSKSAYETVAKKYDSECQLNLFNNIVEEVLRKPEISPDVASACLAQYE